MQLGKKPYDKFKRWVPPPPNPPPMTNEEKEIAITTRMVNPPLCNCGVPAQIHRMVEGAPYTLSLRAEIEQRLVKELLLN